MYVFYVCVYSVHIVIYIVYMYVCVGMYTCERYVYVYVCCI